jgi:hypothetical protein
MALYGNSYGEVIVEAQGSGNAVTAAAATSLLTGSAAQAKFTLPANYFNRIGKQLLVKAYGRISTVVTTPGTARYDVRFGSTVVFDGLAVALATADAYTNQGWELEILLTAFAIGATGNLMGQGRWTSMNIAGSPATPPKGSLVAMLPWNSAPAVGANFDTTASQQVDLFFTQTVATGSVTLHQYQLISVN